LVYYGTGNPGKDFLGIDRGGDNLYTDSVIALDPMTGKLNWYRQEIKHDVWDYDSAYEILLFKKDGRDLLVHLNKSGFVFVMDKLNGNLQNIWRLSDTINFAKDLDAKTGELIGRVEPPIGKTTLICPSAFGARSWNSGSFNPKTGLSTLICLYARGNEGCCAASFRNGGCVGSQRDRNGSVG
jgi:alcohol dehydrogenase (cytochrome c)